MIDVSTLHAQRHDEPPIGWSAEVFDRVTAALALALAAAYRRDHERTERPA